MDAPISINLAHLIIIWTLLIFLFAWMLTFAILALRYRIRSQNNTAVTSTQSGTSDSSRTIYSSVSSLAPAKQNTKAASSAKLAHGTSKADNQVPATPVI